MLQYNILYCDRKARQLGRALGAQAGVLGTQAGAGALGWACVGRWAGVRGALGRGAWQAWRAALGRGPWQAWRAAGARGRQGARQGRGSSAQGAQATGGRRPGRHGVGA